MKKVAVLQFDAQLDGRSMLNFVLVIRTASKDIAIMMNVSLHLDCTT